MFQLDGWLNASILHGCKMLQIIINKRDNIQNQIIQRTIDLINNGMLKAGDLLPSINSLSRTLDVSRTSVIGAYEKMVLLGYLKGKERSGFVVISPINTTSPGRELNDLLQQGITSSYNQVEEEFSLFPNINIPNSFVRKCLANPSLLKKKTCKKENSRSVCNLINMVRRVNINEKTTVLANSINELIIAIAIAIKGHKSNPVVVLESFCSIRIRDIFHSLGFKTIILPIDKDGIQVELLADINADCIYLTPSHHYPTGAILSTERREFLSDWLNRKQAWLIENDSFSLLYLKATLALPFTTTNQGDRSIYITSLSALMGQEDSLSVGYFPESIFTLAKDIMAILFEQRNNFSNNFAYQYIQSNRIVRDIGDLIQKRRDNYHKAKNSIEKVFPQMELWGAENALFFSFSPMGLKSKEHKENIINLIHIKDFVSQKISHLECARILFPYATMRDGDVLNLVEQLLDWKHCFNNYS